MVILVVIHIRYIEIGLYAIEPVTSIWTYMNIEYINNLIALHIQSEK